MILERLAGIQFKMYKTMNNCFGHENHAHVSGLPKSQSQRFQNKLKHFSSNVFSAPSSVSVSVGGKKNDNFFSHVLKSNEIHADHKTKCF